MKTSELIDALSQEPPKARLGTPACYGKWLGAILVIYALGAQYFLGFRVDLAAQLSRPLFVVEVVLLALLAIASVAAAILAIYPDAYQKTLC